MGLMIAMGGIAASTAGCALTEAEFQEPERNIGAVRSVPDGLQDSNCAETGDCTPKAPVAVGTEPDPDITPAPPESDNSDRVSEQVTVQDNVPNDSAGETESTACVSSNDCEPELLCDLDTGVCTEPNTEPSCEDQLLGGEETAIDCGGPDCPACATGQACAAGSDCLSTVCESESCQAASCSDGVKNADEAQIDCGSDTCGPCALGSACGADAECETGTCQGSVCTTAPSCQDNLINGSESDTDCGGSNSNCARCADLSACGVDSDCTSGSCDQGACVSCNDGVANGSETGIDCGGDDPACDLCDPGGGCSLDSDCGSGVCQDGACCGGSEGDCTRCAARLSSTSCQSGGCNSFLQCLSTNRSVCELRFSSGCALEPGDPCDHRLFGGEGGADVQNANQVLVNAGCTLQ